ncbi:MAG: amino acid ABC transporter permease [Clostridiales bacterium]|nr:amino acid ABC transporter permease [Clostridiales bacterium]
MAEVGKTLGIIGVVANLILSAIALLFYPLNNTPAWLAGLRGDFLASSFWIDFENNFITDKRYNYIFKGLGVTFEVTIFAVLLGIALGVIVALVRSSYDTLKEEMRGGFGKGLLWFFNKLCGVYLTVIRGTPVVVQLMIIYFVIFASSNNKILVAVLAFGINSGAYVAEIIRGGIMSIDRGQFEAGRSLGFGYVRTMAFIIIPQAFKTVLPALANEFIVLIKETSVSGYVGLQELTKGGDIIRSRTYSAFMPLIAVAIIYLVIVMFFSWLVSLLERRLKNSER